MYHPRQVPVRALQPWGRSEALLRESEWVWPSRIAQVNAKGPAEGGIVWQTEPPRPHSAVVTLCRCNEDAV